MEEFGFDKLPEVVRQLFQKVENLKKLILNLQPDTTDQNKPLNVRETAEYLDITVPALYPLVNRTEIPVNKPGKRLYFDKNELCARIEAGRKKTNFELQAEANRYLKSRRYLKVSQIPTPLNNAKAGKSKSVGYRKLRYPTLCLNFRLGRLNLLRCHKL